jgi:hypothetical protein
MHTRHWVGTYAGRGNGDYRDELASALRAIATYLRHFALPPQVALVRLDGQYGDAVVIAQLIAAGVNLVTRGRGYRILEHPQLQRALAHPPTASVTRMNTGEVIELFDGGWLPLDEGLPAARVVVARHRAPAPGKPVTVGKRIGEWVYELFITTLGEDRFLVEDVLDLYHGRGAFEGVLADLRCRRRCRPLVFLHRMWARALANRVSMGLESAPQSGTENAGSAAARDRMGTRERIPSPFHGGGRRSRRVWPLAVGCRIRTSHGTLWGRGLHLARRWQTPLPCRG